MMMSNINNYIIIYEQFIANLKNYNILNSEIKKANRNYINAIKCHNSGDNLGFINNLKEHYNREIQIHNLLSHPTFITGGSHVERRKQLSTDYLSKLTSLNGI